jgi:hypothetical protein
VFSDRFSVTPALPLAALLAVLAGAARAEAPAASILPQPRPELTGQASRLAVAASARPAARPGPAEVVSRAAPLPSARPGTRPAKAPGLLRRLFGGGARSGGLCGDPQIRGKPIPAVRGRIRGCGIARPVKVTSVAGVALSQPAELDCQTAEALKTWVAKGLIPAVGRTGGGVKDIVVLDSYQCRTVDNLRGRRLSLHSKGKAIDIAGFVLADGKSIMVRQDWRRRAGRALRRAYRAACGIFGTTISPNGDRYHQTHMHFDTAHYPGGSYCH